MEKIIDIVEGNKLIAEFMGYNQDGLGKWFRDGIFITYHFDYFKYHSSWDWLMPVVEKIEGIDLFNIHIGKRFVRVKNNDPFSTDDIVSVFIKGSKIDSVWQAVVEFITWYNTQKR